jgi:hypothetical protein
VPLGGGGGVLATVSAELPLRPSLVAVKVAEPVATPVARPLPLTVASAVLLDAQAIVRPVSVLPLASLSMALSSCVPPTDSVALAGDTATDATGAVETTAVVMPLATLDSAPKTALRFNVPRNGTS